MPKKLTAIRMKDEVHKELKILAAELELSLNDTLEFLLDKYKEVKDVPRDKATA